MLPSRNLVLALALAVGALTLSGCGSKPPAELPPAKAAEYVALGDSFTAAAGYGPFSDEICKRATDNYPALVAKDLDLTVEDVSCGGAGDIDGLLQAEVITGEGTRQAQFNALSAATRVVTVGIGLNDEVNNTEATLASVLTDLCVPDRKKKRSDTCKAYLALPEKNMSDGVKDMAKQVGLSLDRIRERAPEARIVFVGYPRVLPDAGTCAAVPLPPVALDRLRNVLRATNEALRETAEEHDVEYVDMFTPSKGHDACSAQPWVNGYKLKKDADGAFPFHPFKAYHRAVAEKVVALLKTKEPQA